MLISHNGTEHPEDRFSYDTGVAGDLSPGDLVSPPPIRQTVCKLLLTAPSFKAPPPAHVHSPYFGTESPTDKFPQDIKTPSEVAGSSATLSCSFITLRTHFTFSLNLGF